MTSPMSGGDLKQGIVGFPIIQKAVQTCAGGLGQVVAPDFNAVFGLSGRVISSASWHSSFNFIHYASYSMRAQRALRSLKPLPQYCAVL